MRELRNDKLLEKSKMLYHNVLELKKVDIDNNYCANLFDWFNEIVYSNIFYRISIWKFFYTCYT